MYKMFLGGEKKTNCTLQVLAQKMVGAEFTSSQIQLLKARATKFLNFKQHGILSVEHGVLSKEIDLCLAFGLVS